MRNEEDGKVALMSWVDKVCEETDRPTIDCLQEKKNLKASKSFRVSTIITDGMGLTSLLPNVEELVCRTSDDEAGCSSNAEIEAFRLPLRETSERVKKNQVTSRVVTLDEESTHISWLSFNECSNYYRHPRQFDLSPKGNQNKHIKFIQDLKSFDANDGVDESQVVSDSKQCWCLHTTDNTEDPGCNDYDDDDFQETNLLSWFATTSSTRNVSRNFPFPVIRRVRPSEKQFLGKIVNKGEESEKTGTNASTSNEELFGSSTLAIPSLVLENAYLQPLDFEDFLSSFTKIVKAGEGCYGEVYCCRDDAGTLKAMKVIPIGGLFPVRDDKQPAWDDVLPGIAAELVLNSLEEFKGLNSTSNFVHLDSVHCVSGEYPLRLVLAWKKYCGRLGSENENPDIFFPHQMYLVLLYEYGGMTLEQFEYKNASEAYSTFVQVACSLAIAESALEFEHRNLHLRHVLINTTNENEVSFRFRGEDMQIASHGVHVTIIGFGLSRLKQGDYVLSCDVSQQPYIFQGVGDEQFDIYRYMRDRTGGQWEQFFPFTNVLWLHYLLVKLCKEKRYKNKRWQHEEHLRQLREYAEDILMFKSATEFVMMYANKLVNIPSMNMKRTANY